MGGKSNPTQERGPDTCEQSANPLKLLGPGLITGASDDDPSGIATYSQVGAQFGYSLSWVMLFSWPLMCAVQEISARIGRVTGRGIAGNLRKHYPAWVGFSIVSLLVIANVINLGADLGAMGAALKLLVGGPALLYVALFGLASLLLEIFVNYDRYVSILKWLSLSLLAYVGVAFIADIPWGTVGYNLIVPQMALNNSSITAVVAVLGTTISPYLFFWQAEGEVEDVNKREDANPLRQAPEQATPEFRRIRWDTYAGMGVSNLVALFIILTTAATLHAHGITNIQTSSQAAEALRPIAGPFAFGVFALGIIGTGLLALPVLAGSAAYALGEMLGWRVGLLHKARRAKAFYGALAAATLIGVVLNFTAIDPIKALFWSAVINGVVAVPVMGCMMHISSKSAAMGEFKLPIGLKAMGWTTTLVMACAAVGLMITA
jgi:NRAMP (natural resistance-associated macrophage protein)-like metal ion transporter